MTYIAVCGPALADEQERLWAEEIGRLIAEGGGVLVCGGLGGVMDAAAAGASAAGGAVLGILPGDSRAGESPSVTVSVPTGLGEARNALVARSADVLIAVSGEFGTLSEIALALKMGRPVIGLSTWELSKGGQPNEAIVRAGTAADAVRLAFEAVG